MFRFGEDSCLELVPRIDWYIDRFVFAQHLAFARLHVDVPSDTVLGIWALGYSLVASVPEGIGFLAMRSRLLPLLVSPTWSETL